MHKAILTSILTVSLTVFLQPAAEMAYNALEKPHKRRSSQTPTEMGYATSSVLERLSGLVFGADCSNGICIDDDQIIIDTDGTEFTINKLINAIYLAEGGENAKKPFGILSIACEGFNDCRRICRNTVRNQLRRFATNESKQGEDRTYLASLANRYAPIGAGNDKAYRLNKNWLPNVRGLL